jgi:hypothetical protein
MILRRSGTRVGAVASLDVEELSKLSGPCSEKLSKASVKVLNIE